MQIDRDVKQYMKAQGQEPRTLVQGPKSRTVDNKHE